MTTNDVATLLSLIEARYGSLEHPSFSFVTHVVEENPYRIFVKQLREMGDVEDVTDLNDDVSFAYTVRDKESEWYLMLSMLGPYAVLLRPDGKVYRVSEKRAGVSGLEERVHNLLAGHGLHVLGRPLLETPVALQLHNTGPERVRLFQALFTDTDFLPWDEASAA